MERIVIFISLYFSICIVFFWMVQRPLFCYYNRVSNFGKIRLCDLKQIYVRGLVTDAIVAAYLTVLPLLILWMYVHFPFFRLYPLLTCSNTVLSILVALVVVADTALYRFWQFKIDASIFVYLRSLKGIFASVSAGYITVAFASVLLTGGIFFTGIQTVTHIYCQGEMFAATGWVKHSLTFGIFVLLNFCLFAIIRGLHSRPHNPSTVYYSNNPFYNHCALNPLYSLIYSLSIQKDFKGQFHRFEDSYCQKVFKSLFPVTGTPQVRLLNTTRPNILLIVWESLSARFMESLGGMSGVTVNLDRLAREGVLFTHCDAGSFQTDRGLVCLLSGYLGQPTTSVIKYTRKLPNLPAFPRVLKREGYSTMALHGGDLAVMHKSDYYLASGHDKLIGQQVLSSSALTCKWGIHDDYTFSWLYNDIEEKNRQNIRWFTTFQTLSSHEPFDVPYHRLDNKMANAFAYTDACLGILIDKLKASPAWKNLLVICVGDHGVNYGHNYGPQLPRNKFPHIPLLFLGGAVKQPLRIDTIMSQTDLAATLLGQLDLPHEDFIFSRDVLAETYAYPFSFHTYNNGFLFRDATGYTNYDNIVDKAMEGADSRREELGKVILQTLYEDLSNR